MKTKLRIRNFRCLEDVEIELSPYTFLFGPNGSGKSTVIKAIAALFQDVMHPDFDFCWQKKLYDLKYIKISDDIENIKYDVILELNNDDWKQILQLKYDHITRFSEAHQNSKMISALNDESEIAELFKLHYSRFYSVIETDSLNPELYSLINNFDSSFLYINNVTDQYNIAFNGITEIQKNIKELIEKERDAYYNEVLHEEKVDLNEIYKNLVELNFKHPTAFDINIGITFELNFDKLIPRYKIFSKKLDAEFEIFGGFLFLNNLEGINFNLNKHFAELSSYKSLNDLDFSVILWILIQKYGSDNPGDLLVKVNYIYLLLYIAVKQTLAIWYNHAKTVRDLPEPYYDLYKNDYNDEYKRLLYTLPDEKTALKLISGEMYEDEVRSEYEIYLNMLDVFRKFGFCDYFYKVENTPLFSIEFIRSGRKVNLASASSGFQQLFLVIYYAFYRFNQVLLIEQPELHLNPKLQSYFVDFLTDKIKDSYYKNYVRKSLSNQNMAKIVEINTNLYKNLNVIETHSEHIIRRLQILIAENKVKIDEVSVFYFRENEEGKIEAKALPLDEKGNFIEEWPDGFFDEASNLTFELLKAQLKKGSEN